MLIKDKSIRKSVVDAFADTEKLFNFLEAQHKKKQDGAEMFDGYIYVNVQNPERGRDKAFAVHAFEGGRGTGVALFYEGRIDTSQCMNPRCIMFRIGAWMMDEELKKQGMIVLS